MTHEHVPIPGIWEEAAKLPMHEVRPFADLRYPLPARANAETKYAVDVDTFSLEVLDILDGWQSATSVRLQNLVHHEDNNTEDSELDLTPAITGFVEMLPELSEELKAVKELYETVGFVTSRLPYLEKMFEEKNRTSEERGNAWKEFLKRLTIQTVPVDKRPKDQKTLEQELLGESLLTPFELELIQELARIPDTFERNTLTDEIETKIIDPVLSGDAQEFLDILRRFKLAKGRSLIKQSSLGAYQDPQFAFPLREGELPDQTRLMVRSLWHEGIWHDIGQPLTPIIGISDMLLRRQSKGIAIETNPQTQENLKTIINKLDDLTPLIQSAYDGISLQFPKESLPPSRLQQILQDKLSPLIKYGISVHVSMNPSLADDVDIVEYADTIARRLVTNSESNSKKAFEVRDLHMPERALDPKEVRANLRKSQDGKFVVMTIADTGSGIRSEEVKKDGVGIRRGGWGDPNIPSRGVGLAVLRMVSEAFYGVRCDQRDVLDDAGNVLGAEFEYQIPLKQQIENPVPIFIG